MKFPAIFLAALFILGALAPGLAASQIPNDTELILRVAMQDDIKGTNPFTANDYYTVLGTQWLYDSPVFIHSYRERIDARPYYVDKSCMVPYIAVGSANVSGQAGSWDDCAIGNFGYSPKTAWANPGKREAIIFYDFENVKWHDGEQMDIRDIMFSYHATAQDPVRRGVVECLAADNYSQNNWLHIEKVWESGYRAALRFTLHTPYWQFFNRTLAVRLLPEHVWAYTVSGQNVDGAKIWCDAGYNMTATDSWKLSLARIYANPNPVGSGPLMWKNWTRGQWLDITTWRGHFFKPGYRYEEYSLDEWGQSPAVQPHIDGVRFTIYKTTEAAILALKNNDIDYIAWNIPPTFVQELSSSPKISMYQSMEPGFTYMAYNMRKTSFGYKDGDPAKGDSGAPLRKAIAHLIDKNTFAARMLLGMGMPASGPISSISPYYNSTIPRYSYDPSGAKRILANAGYQVKRASDGTMLTGQAAIDAAGDGNWWHNPDGTPIGSSAGGRIEIIYPDANYDPIRAQAVLMIAKSLRDAGIYAESMYDWGWGMNRIENREFDIYVYGWKNLILPTEYLDSLFNSKYTAVGYNYPGYQNKTFDNIMALARSTDNDTVRKNAIFEAQASICYDLPYDVLYFRTNIEVCRSDRFTGWEVDASGSIFNTRSLRLLTGPNPYFLSAQFVSPPSAVLSNSTTPISVLVKDQDGNPVSGAEVSVKANCGLVHAEAGITSSNGKCEFSFTAPYADPNNPDTLVNGTQVILQIEYAKYTNSTGWKYDDASVKLVLIRVYPEDVPFVSVSMHADPDTIDPDNNTDGTAGFTFVYVRVTDQNGDPVAGASVALLCSPDVPSIEPTDQPTDADGGATFMVTATNLPDNDGSVKEYVLTAIAIHPDDSTIRGENSICLSIVDAVPSEPPPPRTYAGETFLAIIAVCAAAVAISAVIRRKRK